MDGALSCAIGDLAYNSKKTASTCFSLFRRLYSSKLYLYLITIV